MHTAGHDAKQSHGSLAGAQGCGGFSRPLQPVPVPAAGQACHREDCFPRQPRSRPQRDGSQHPRPLCPSVPPAARECHQTPNGWRPQGDEGVARQPHGVRLRARTRVLADGIGGGEGSIRAATHSAAPLERAFWEERARAASNPVETHGGQQPRGSPRYVRRNGSQRGPAAHAAPHRPQPHHPEDRRLQWRFRQGAGHCRGRGIPDGRHHRRRQLETAGDPVAEQLIEPKPFRGGKVCGAAHPFAPWRRTPRGVGNARSSLRQEAQHSQSYPHGSW
mmetsp:Transcript_19076/g.38555  ORF Transcript_19076/g.38555 Transcript_19076/m.38555 type:complete len:276 (+) Transcript_19076:176-1003(+)